MQISKLFAKDINRPINGVIKVAQDDTDSIQQELSEYVVTNELQRHFADFFEAYDRAIDVPTDKVGVWISGFFGSGKSHFLKMLSYLLSNREVGGVPAVKYFDGKVADPMVYSRMQRAAAVPTESILFNIDSKGGQWKGGVEAKTALLLTFARMFYEHLGFYGEDLKLARMEQFVESQGKTDEFRAAFARINGGDWLADRPNYLLFEDDVVEVMQEVLGMSREAAQHWFDGTETAAISPDRLTDEIAAYAARRAEECGGQFRLLFMVDEVGQFIGGDVNLMLNLQTIVEDLGAKAAGRVWVMVTSQEAIDEVTRVAGNDFSKIQGRFNTRLSLSSSSADEVIKRRVLEKTDAARAALAAEYDEQSAVLKNLFAFEDSQSDLRGFSGPADFAATYPFVDYQFKIMPSVLAEIRKHGNSGKHLSGGERSMLSGFQEAAQKVQERESTALVPLWRFYDTIATFLEHGIRQVIERATRAAEGDAGLVPDDVRVLKTLYLIRYLNDIKPTVGNIAILMVDDMGADKIVLREAVKGSLDRLVRENYVARNGDAYHFLTDEEQDVAREIKDTRIDAAAITEEIKKIVFDGLYTARKYRKGANDFAFDRFVDDTIYGQSQNGMKLNVVTVGLPELSEADDGTLALKSTDQALVVLPEGDDRYYEALMNAARIKKYVNTQNVPALSSSRQNIIKGKQAEAARNKKEAQEYLEEALGEARVAVNGRMVDRRALGGRTAKATLDGALDELVSSVYTKADYITAPAAGVIAILAGTAQTALAGTDGANERAVEAVETYLDNQGRLHLDTSMGDLQRRFAGRPFGWRDVDTAAVVARLLAEGRASARLSGKTLNASDPNERKRIAENLMGKGADGLAIAKRQLPSATLVNGARAILRDLPGAPSAPDDIDGLVRAVREVLEAQKAWANGLLKDEYGQREYPGRALVEQGLTLASGILQSQADEVAFLKAFTDAGDELLDWAEDAEAVRGFFPNQQRLFDAAAKLQEAMAAESVYLVDSREAQDALGKIAEILNASAPYQRISELPALGDAVRRAHDEVVRVGRSDLLDSMEATMAEIHDYAEGAPLPAGFMDSIEQELAQKKSRALAADSRSQLDAFATQLEVWRNSKLASIDRAIEEARDAAAREEAMRIRKQDDVTIKKPIPRASSVSGAASVGSDLGRLSRPDDAPQSAPASHRPRIKTIERRDLCQAKRLTSEEDIDAYVEAIRKKLTAALADSDSVSVR